MQALKRSTKPRRVSSSVARGSTVRPNQALPILSPNPTCDSCFLSENPDLTNRGIPSRPWDGHSPSTFTKAVFLVGAYPGRKEDELGRAFVGASGLHMNGTYIQGAALHKYADCYIGNAIRCRPMDPDSVGEAPVKACRQHLIADLQSLAGRYSELIVVCCGTEAIKAVTGKAYSMARFPQGRKLKLYGVEFVVFATSNPARLLRDPSNILSVMEHMLMVNRYVRLGRLHDSLALPPMKTLTQGEDPPPDVGLVSLDIETHGCSKGFPRQTGFHPQKSLVTDKCPREHLVTTVALSWRPPEGGEMQHKVWVMTEAAGRAAFIRAIRRIKNLRILGQNVQFDILYLRALGQPFRDVFNRDRCFLADLMTVSYLENDQRPERSLKNLVVVAGIDDYYREPVKLDKGQRYESPHDPRLWLYNVRDTRNTMLCYELFVGNIEQRYGSDTEKWKPFCQQWYSEKNWLAIEMSENGVPHDATLLELRHAKLLRKCEWLRELAKEKWGLIVGGKGVEASIRDFLADCIDKYAPKTGPQASDFQSRLVVTAKTQKISRKDENVKLVKGILPPKAEKERAMLKVYATYVDWSKQASSFTGPLLGYKDDPDERQAALVKGIAYPSWHVSPSQASAHDKGQGGTKQVRFAARNPSLQNFPKRIKHCQRSRWPDGALVNADQSQIELRVPAALSGDPIMLDIFRRGISLHAKTGSWLAKREITKKTDPLYYVGGKTVNFLRLFGGNAWKLQHTLMADLGLFIELEDAEEFLINDKREYKVLYAWQDSLIKEAQTRGLLDVPLIGASRTFLGQRVDEFYYNEILNIRVQAMAAAITQSAQWEAEKEFRKRKLRALTISNTHDDGGTDCPKEEVEEVSSILKECFLHPPIWEEWKARGLVHDVPLDSELTVRYNPSWRPETGEHYAGS